MDVAHFPLKQPRKVRLQKVSSLGLFAALSTGALLLLMGLTHQIRKHVFQSGAAAVAGSGWPGRGVWSSLTHPVGVFTQVSWLPLTEWAACSGSQWSPFQVLFCSLMIDILNSSVQPAVCFCYKRRPNEQGKPCFVRQYSCEPQAGALYCLTVGGFYDR